MIDESTDGTLASDSKPAVLTQVDGAVGILTFNRPESLHTLDVPMLLAMENALSALENTPGVRVIVCTGAGPKAFMAGGDIADLHRRRGLAHYLDFGETVRRVFRRFETCALPTIAAVNGLALGGGMEFMLTMDLRLMSESARLGLPEIRLGLFPGGGGSQRLMRQLPLCQAKMLMFTGDAIDAQEALRLGLVNRVTSAELLMPESLALAHRLAANAPIALRLLKQSMLHGREMPLDAALAYEQSNISLVFDSDDAHEGCEAFLGKRAAAFTGR
ncbi:MAG: Enoyl-CoA hydratase [Rhizobacter sp.]|nr:Enoyl-CoA hydratase [Rhizobacter sp.]